MKKFIISIAVMVGSVQMLVAQQVPLFSQYFYNMFIYNPAFVGSYTRPQLYVLNRNQWTNIPDAPVTRGATFEASLNKDLIGLGGYLMQDNSGAFRNVNGQIDYSYKVKLGDSTNLYLGLGAGFNSIGIDFNKLKKHQENDPLLLGQPANRNNFDGIGGVVFNWKRLDVGMSVPQLFNTAAKFNQSTQEASVLYRSVRHFVGSVDYLFTFKNGMSIKPVYVIKKGGRSMPFQHEIMSIVSYKNTYWGSLAYRTSYGITGAVGFKIFDKLTLGYAYDFNTSSIRNYTGQTHELIVGYRFGSEIEKINKKINKIDSINIRQDSALYSHDTAFKALYKKDSIHDATIKKNFETLSTDIKKTRVELLDSIYHAMFHVGDRFTLTRIYFKNDHADLLPGSKTEINDLITLLNRYPKLEIEIIGFTDAMAGEAYNSALSKKRAEAVYNYLVANGIAKDRLKMRGAGKSEYVGDNDSETGKQLNRRVEFRVTKM